MAQKIPTYLPIAFHASRDEMGKVSCYAWIGIRDGALFLALDALRCGTALKPEALKHPLETL